MADRRPLALVSGRTKELPTGDNLKIGNATLDVSALTTGRTVTFQDKAGTVAMTSDITGGDVRDNWLFG